MLDAFPSTTLRIVNTLEDLGFLEAVADQGAYRAGPSALCLGYDMIASSRLRVLALPALRRLLDACRESITLGLFWEDSIFVIEHCRTRDPLAIPFQIGARLPIHVSASGKAVLAFADQNVCEAALRKLDARQPKANIRETALAGLAQVRQDKYAIQDEELLAGVRSIAAPVFAEDGTPVAAVAIAVGAGRYGLAELRQALAPLVIGCAAEISARLRSDSAPALPRAPQVSDDAGPGIDAEQKSRYHVEALARGLQTLLAFTPATPSLALTEVARRTDGLVATTFRVISTLTNMGYLRLDKASGRYELTVKVLTLGYDSLVWLDIAELCRPRLLRVQRETGQSVFFSVLAGDDAVDIVSIRQPGISTTVGRKYPLYCTPGGKVLLAFASDERRSEILSRIALVPRGPKTLTDRAQLDIEISRIRRNGFSVVEEEFVPGVFGAGVPIFDQNQNCVAALATSVSSASVSLSELNERILPMVREAGRDLSERLAWRFT
jgi:IclR family pca regulon transcriptional regulator